MTEAGSADPTALVVGLGEPSRGDDGAGPEAVRRLKSRFGGGVRIVERLSEPTALLDLWENVRLAVVVDAARSGAPAGTVRRLEGKDLAGQPLERRTSSHGLTLADALELGVRLGRMPRRLVIYAIEGSSFETGEGLSAPVARGVEETVRRVTDELRAPGHGVAPEAG